MCTVEWSLQNAASTRRKTIWTTQEQWMMYKYSTLSPSCYAMCELLYVHKMHKVPIARLFQPQKSSHYGGVSKVYHQAVMPCVNYCMSINCISVCNKISLGRGCDAGDNTVKLFLSWLYSVLERKLNKLQAFDAIKSKSCFEAVSRHCFKSSVPNSKHLTSHICSMQFSIIHTDFGVF